jgi:hypothetical protein
MHARRFEEAGAQEGLHRASAVATSRAHRIADDAADDVGGAAGVVPARTRLVQQRQPGGVCRHVVRARAVQHLQAVADRVVDVVLHELQAGPHVEQVLQGDRGLGRALPLGHRRRRIELQATLADQDADGRMRDALGHAPRHQSGVGSDRAARPEHRVGLLPVAFEDHGAGLHHHQCQRQAVRRIGREQGIGGTLDGGEVDGRHAGDGNTATVGPRGPERTGALPSARWTWPRHWAPTSTSSTPSLRAWWRGCTWWARTRWATGRKAPATSTSWLSPPSPPPTTTSAACARCMRCSRSSRCPSSTARTSHGVIC